MTRLIRSLVVVGGLAALVGAAPAGAQVLEEVTFTTSFPFTVDHKTLPGRHLHGAPRVRRRWLAAGDPRTR